METKITKLILCLLALCLLCTACKSNAQPDSSSSPSVATESPSELPLTKEITISREGMEETLTARLTTSSMGYSIYLFEGFELVQTDDGDIIRSSELLDTIYMKIVRSDWAYALPEDSVNKDGALITYRRITLGDHIFDVETSFPSEAEEGAAVLTSAMIDTIRF